MSTEIDEQALAIVGLACRFPGVPDFTGLGALLREGREGITRLTADDDESPAHLRRDPRYVPAAGLLDGVEEFDHAAFGMSHGDAVRLDPQQRLLLELGREALDDADLAPADLAAPIGVYAGTELSQYLVRHLLPGLTGPDDPRWYPTVIANDKDFAASQLAFRLDLRGPAVGVQGACATGLVALHVGAQALLAGECDLSLVGAAALRLPARSGYLSQPGGLFSADGHTRSFDALGSGTVYGSGGAVLVLRRLADAIAAGNRLWAVVRGSAVYNDGAARPGFAAPTVKGHVHALAEALAVAGLDPSDIQYVEGNGTATPLGDALEIAAWKQVFRGAPVHVGSVRSNLGHLQSAAGLAGLLKCVWALREGSIPATLHFQEPNHELRGSGLQVDSALTPWPTRAGRRRAAVSAFGVGGVHATAILEQSSDRTEPRPSRGRRWQRARCWVNPPARGGPPASTQPDDLAALVRRLADLLPPGSPLPSPDRPLAELGVGSLDLLTFLAELEGQFPAATACLMTTSWSHFSLREITERLRPRSEPAPRPTPDGLVYRLVEVPGGRLEVLCGGEGPPALFLPPMGCSADVWSPVLRRLTDTMQVFAVSPPGFGRSEGPAEWSAQLLAALEVLAVDRPVHLVGWSHGGCVALGCALDAPERWGSLTLACTSARPLPRPSFTEMRALLAALLAAAESELAANAEARALFASRAAPAALEQARTLLSFDALARLPELRMPVMLVAGAHDAVLPAEHTDALAARIVHARRFDFAEVGHFLPVTAADRFVAAWLAFTRGEADTADRSGSDR